MFTNSKTVQNSVKLVNVTMSDTFSNIPAFDCIDSVNLAGRWRRWRRSFAYYLDARGTMPPTRKKALLLHTAGIQVQDIFETVGGGSRGGRRVQSSDPGTRRILSAEKQRVSLKHDGDD